MKGQQKSSEPDVNVPVIEEGAVATAEDPSAIATIQSASTFSSEQPIKYLFKTEGAGGQVGELYPPSGQVTYRVIQVADGQLEAQTDGATAVSVVTGFPATTQPVTQAIFSHSEGLDGDGTETHYTYYPATISDAAAGTMVTSVQASDALLSQSAPAVSQRDQELLEMIKGELSTTKLSEDVETKLTTGLFSCQKQFQTAPSMPLKLDRVRVGFYQRPAITFRSCDRVTAG
ncbi:upstream stimulatory factor [Pimephales promelas]|nr:upstream stimulatory factor [Pimephales promelas]